MKRIILPLREMAQSFLLARASFLFFYCFTAYFLSNVVQAKLKTVR